MAKLYIPLMLFAFALASADFVDDTRDYEPDVDSVQYPSHHMHPMKLDYNYQPSVMNRDYRTPYNRLIYQTLQNADRLDQLPKYVQHMDQNQPSMPILMAQQQRYYPGHRLHSETRQNTKAIFDPFVEATNELERMITSITHKISQNLDNVNFDQDTNYLTIIYAINRLVNRLICPVVPNPEVVYDHIYTDTVRDAIIDIDRDPREPAKTVLWRLQHTTDKVARATNLVNSAAIKELCKDKSNRECDRDIMIPIIQKEADADMRKQFTLLVGYYTDMLKVQDYLREWDEVTQSNMAREYLFKAQKHLKPLVLALLRQRRIAGIDVPICTKSTI